MNTKSFQAFALASAMALGATAVHAQSAFYQAVTSLNPAAYWPLQETAAPPAADIETNLGSLGAVADAYYSSVNVSHQTGGVTGDGDSAAGFQSSLSGSFLAVPATNGVTVPAGPFTVEAWVNPATIVGSVILAQTGPSGLGGLNGSANSAGWSLNENYIPSTGAASAGCWSFHVHNGVGAGGGAEAVALMALNTYTWYHLVGVFDGTSAHLYVDGTNAGSSSSINGAYVPDAWDPLTIGCGRGLNNNRFNGTIDEVAIYPAALTPTQIANHYNAVNGSGYASTILGDAPSMYWRMDAPAYGGPATSYPAANNIGTSLSGGLYLSGTTPGLAGPAYAGFGSPSYACGFNGIGTDNGTTIPYSSNSVSIANIAANSGVVITNLDPLLNLKSNSITVMTWFKGNPADTGARFQTLLGHGNSSWRLNLDNGSGVGGKVTFNPGMGSDLVSSGVYNDGNWHLAVGVYYNSGNAAAAGWLATNYLYVDGVLNGSAEVTNAAAATSAINVLLGGAPDYVAGGTGYNQRFFAGSLAHAAYFTNALTAAQIQSLYNAAAATPAFQSQPAAVVTGNAGATNVFTVSASGAATLAYQWYENSSSNYTGASALSDGPLGNGAGLTGSATAALSVTNLQAGSAGYYYVVVQNNYGAVTSAISRLVILAAPVITAQNPAGSFVLYPNQALPLSVTASGPAPLTYQWFTNGVADTVAGAAAVYPVTGAATASGTTYQCVITNTYGAATSVLATVTVQALPAFLTGTAYSSGVLALNPQGYWPMHEVETPLHGDSETNLGSLGPLANGYYADWTAPGSNIMRQVSGALAGDTDPAVNFYGVSNSIGTGYMLVPRTVASGLKPPFTVEAWVNPYNTTGGDIVSQSGYGVNANNTGNVYGFRLMWQPNGFEIGCGSSTSNTFALLAGYGHGPGQWYHVAATYDGTNATLYVNGQQEGSSPLPYALDSAEPLVIGSGFWGSSGPTRGFAGSVDEVAVYTNVLQSADISQHYSDGINPAPATSYYHDVTNDNPVLYYRMDAPAYVPPPVNTWAVMTNYGSVALNGVYSPASLPGALSGANAGVLPLGISGTNMLPGNGLNAYADAGYNPAFNPTGHTSISVSGWFKANPADSRFQILFGNDSTWRCAMDGTVGKVHFNAGAGGEITSARVYNDGNWHQVVGVYNGTTSSNLLYVDGVLDSQTSTGTGTEPASTADIMMLTDPQYTNSPAGLGRQFAGSVCDVAVWTNTIISAAQVQALYNSADVPPFITAQPVTGRSVSGGPGTYIFFGVAANGSTTLNYQWYFNNSPSYAGATALVNGAKYALATTPQVTVTNLGAGDSGYYYVVVTNNYGAVTSSLASLVVYTNPVFVAQSPVTYTNPFTLFAGAAPVFSVTTAGILPITYQWYTNGVAAGAAATGTSYTITPQQTDFTVYCVAANSSGYGTSTVWNASVIADPTNPYPQAVLADNPVGYWRLNEVPDNGLGNGGALCTDYAGGNNGIYTNVVLGGNFNFGVPSYSSTDPNEPAVAFGEYRNNGSSINSYANINGVDFAALNGTTTNFTVEAWVNGYAGQGTGYAILSKGVYSLNDAFVFDFDSASTHHFRFYIRTATGTVVNCTTTKSPDGNWHHLVGVCDESAGFVYFYIDGTLVSTTSISTTAGLYEPNYPLSIGSVQSSSETAAYSLQFQGYVSDVAVYNYALSGTQIDQQFSASGTAPFFIQEPVAATNVDAGGTLTVPATVGGSAPLSLQWWGNYPSLAALPGQTNATLVVSNVPAAGSIGYYLVAANAYGSTQSLQINVNVIAGAPQIYQDITPPAWSAYANSRATFTVGVYGTAPMYYQWVENGNAIAGATNSAYNATVALGTNLLYCVISNAYNGGSLIDSSTGAVVGVSLPTSAYARAVLSNNPAAYWPLNETNGAIANDYIGNHDAVYTNVELGVPGFATNTDLAAWFGTLDSIDSYAGELNGAADGIPNLDFSGVGNAQFSVEAWVNGGSSQIASAGLVAKGYSGNEQFALDCYNGVFRFFVHDSVNVVHICTASVGPDGNWHHLVGVCDQQNGLLHLYVDGVDNADADIQAGKGVSAASGAALPAGNLVSLGARDSAQSATDMDWQFVGRMQDVAIYSYALTAAQVAADYQAGTTPVVNTAPTNIVVSVSGNQLTLAWPADNTGWQLQAQTNAPGAGLGTNWVNVGGSTGVNSLVIPMNTTNGSVFYRLVYP